jgi:hypothetical protein
VTPCQFFILTDCRFLVERGRITCEINIDKNNVESENEEMRVVIELCRHEKTTIFNLKSKYI